MNTFRCLYGICLALYFNALSGQSVSISPEVNIKNDFAYYFFPHPNGTVSLIRDKSFRLSIQTLTNDFTWSSERSIELIGNKWRLVDIYESNDALDILYTTKIDDTHHLILARYNTQGILLQNKKILDGTIPAIMKNLYAYASENKNWICIRFDDVRSHKSLLLYNRNLDSVFYHINLNELLNESEELQIKGLVVSNQGEVFIHGKSEDALQKRNKKIEYVQVVDISGNLIIQNPIVHHETTLFQTEISLDNQNNRCVFVGLYAEKNGKYPEGYIYYAIQNKIENTFGKKIPFTPEMLKEWKGELNHKREWRDGELKLQDIIFTTNGGSLVFFENTKEISRRPYFSSIDPSTNFTSRWFDYYFDDVLGVHFDTTGAVLWERVLHKRQYSQDDEGIFSSFFVFKTAALLRIIFNDAVNSDGTVSEYLLKPNGDHIRKSVLNTTYKNLNLRFRDAIALSAQSMLIPSEDNGKLTLVRISFDH
ncbi:MAG: hypothetical protein IPM92_15975 [Saprospiraceae bacterium]|nr:hypothetical protein [Saprospiraceae bacterium]